MKNVCTLLDSNTGELFGIRFEDIDYATTKTNVQKNEYSIHIYLKNGKKIIGKMDNREHQKAAINDILKMIHTDNEEPPEEVKEAQRQAAKEAMEKAAREYQEALEKDKLSTNAESLQESQSLAVDVPASQT